MKKIISVLLAVTLVISSFTGCGKADVESTATVGETLQETVESSTPDSSREETKAVADAGNGQAFAVITDVAGRQVTLEKVPERIVSGYYITTSMLIALGLTDRIVGIEARAEERPIYKLAAQELLSLPNVGTAKEFNLEGCLAMEPDLVILPLKLVEQADMLAGMGVPAMVVSPESTELLKETLQMVGEATKTRQQAEKLIQYYDTQIERMNQMLMVESTYPTVYMAGTGEVLKVATGNMYQNSVIETAGGINVAMDLKDKGWAKISYEQLIAYNPEVIVIIPEAGYTSEDVLADPQLSQVSAVKNQKVYQMPSDFEAWDSPVPSGILGSMWLTSILHPERYSYEEFVEDATAFYLEFYGVEIDSSALTENTR